MQIAAVHHVRFEAIPLRPQSVRRIRALDVHELRELLQQRVFTRLRGLERIQLLSLQVLKLGFQQRLQFLSRNQSAQHVVALICSRSGGMGHVGETPINW